MIYAVEDAKGQDHWHDWKRLGDLAAELAMKIQATPGAPRRIVREALELIEIHRKLRPEMYGAPR